MRKQSVRNKRKQSAAFREYRAWYKSMGIPIQDKLAQGRSFPRSQNIDTGEPIHPFTYIYEKN